ncbi:MAG TPA: TonB-dependent receptor [Chitinophagaceae bacterium]|nr:TonB-dependent receptor [Chitinophagaceae bacterium]
MARIFLCMIALLAKVICIGQYNLQVKVISGENKEALVAATVSIPVLGKTGLTDSGGLARFAGIPKGNYKITASYTGYAGASGMVELPGSDTIVLQLHLEDEEEEEVIVQSTRTSRSIRNIPTRVELIALEEIDEKTNMRPGNVSMLLHESTGIQVQQTSATSGNASIRLQGLDGRYTQLLKDAYANYGNFSSGLSVMEIPPLDLKQVEIIKGPASTLYGGGAIAGVINFISKTPQYAAENNLLVNYSSISQGNIGFYSSKRNKRVGYTLLAQVNKQRAFDVDKDDFTEVPKSLELAINPKLFFYPDERSVVIIGNSFSHGTLEGGDVQVLKNKGDAYHQYFEKNRTIRNITTMEWQRKIDERKSFTLKQSLSIFDRHISIPAYHFHGTSSSTFTDFSYLDNLPRHTLVAGGTLTWDRFREKNGSAQQRNNTTTALGGYLQDTWDISSVVKIEGGLRLESAGFQNSLFSKREFFVLPRISLLLQYGPEWSSRIGGGMGYKLPTLFTERTESFQYKGVQQLEDVKAERSYGSTADLNFRTSLGGALNLAVNQLVFYTSISDPLILEEKAPGEFSFVNASRHVRSMGMETNVKLIYRRVLKLFLGYTLTKARAGYLADNQHLPLVPEHKFNSALIFEKDHVVKMGLEAYYTSPQYLYNGLRTSGYWEAGFMVEKIFEKFSVYINLENFTDTRQSRYKGVANGQHSQPVFDDIWTHTEGFVMNGGVKIRF